MAAWVLSRPLGAVGWDLGGGQGNSVAVNVSFNLLRNRSVNLHSINLHV